MSPGSEPQQPATTLSPQRVALPAAAPYITYVLLGFTVLVYFMQLFLENSAGGNDWLVELGARNNTWIRAGEIWRFITPVFLHASPPHLLFNMYALFVLGVGLEQNFGHARFFSLYFLSAFAGNVLSFYFGSDFGYSVGASTAIFGLVAAQGIFLYQNRFLFGRQVRRGIGNIIFIVVINLFIGLTPGIDNWGHIGGLLGGLIFSSFAGPRFQVVHEMDGPRLDDERDFHAVIFGAATVIMIFGGLAFWGMTSG